MSTVVSQETTRPCVPTQETHLVLTDREHCLLRPDMSIGSIIPVDTTYWAIEVTGESDTTTMVSSVETSGYRVVERTAFVPPALLQLLLEIVTNATDHASREGTGVKSIRLTMNTDTGQISVTNDGKTIPIRPHKQFPDRYLTTVIFSEFKCGSNFDDSVDRKQAGRNGYGAKATNAWCTYFDVDHNDGEQRFQQTWTNNMAHCTEPKITASKRKGSYTTITFIPDYARLGVVDIPAAIDYLRSFAWHICAVTPSSISIWLDGIKLPVRNLKDYAKILCPTGPSDVIYDEGENMQVAVCPVRPGFPTSIGFVNAIPCSAGTHMNYALNRVRDIVNHALGKDRECSAAVFKQHLIMMVNITATNPTFSSQTKEQLTLDMRKTGASWTPSAQFETKLRGSAIVTSVKTEYDIRETHKAALAAAKGTSGRSRVVSIPDYEGAHNAGKANRRVPCCLILTEGLSAKTFAVAGMTVVGRDNYGVFPVRGKLKNVWNQPLASILKTEEISNVLRILGINLSASRRPTSTQELRYDRIIGLFDQDLDGNHIFGLLAMLLATLVPELVVNCPDLLQRFGTPLVKAWPKRGKGESKEFMSEPEFDTWWRDLGSDAARSKYKIKYFKGLGTSTPADAKQCFSHLETYLVGIDFSNPEARQMLIDCFAKDKNKESVRVEKRRELMTRPIKPPLDYAPVRVDGCMFLEGELMPYFRYDNERSIPDAVDGFKTVMRKIMWVLKTKYGDLRTPDVKVAQFSARVAEETLYKHGEGSICGSVVGMGQDTPICGNNMNLLVPGGMFGDRHGAEAASPRYIYTCGEPIAFVMYPPDDDAVLTLLQCEGSVIEPKRMVPVIPTVLCNGAEGIGVGWSCKVPSCNPETVITFCRRLNRELRTGRPQTYPDLEPWLEGFEGEITRVGPHEWLFKGKIEQISPREVHITELPVKTSDFLFGTSKSDVKFREKYPHSEKINSTDVTVDIVLKFDAEISPALFSRLQDRATLSVKTSNMNLWADDPTKPTLFASLEDIARYHAKARLDLYAKRKAYQIEQLQQRLVKLNDKYRFVVKVMENPAYMFKRSKSAVSASLDEDGFTRFDGGYDHLFQLPMGSATEELLERLLKDKDEARATLERLEAMTPHDMWDEDLETLRKAYIEFMEVRKERRKNPIDISPLVPTSKRPAKTKGIGRVTKRLKQ